MWDQPGFVFSPATTLGLLDYFALMLLETAAIISVFVLLFWYIRVFFYIFKCTTHLTQLPFNSGNSTAAQRIEKIILTRSEECAFLLQENKQTTGLYQMWSTI